MRMYFHGVVDGPEGDDGEPFTCSDHRVASGALIISDAVGNEILSVMVTRQGFVSVRELSQDEDGFYLAEEVYRREG